MAGIGEDSCPDFKKCCYKRQSQTRTLISGFPIQLSFHCSYCLIWNVKASLKDLEP